MEAVFLYLAERSTGAGIVIAAVIALRYLLRDAPKAFRMLLWAVVALRLLCPYVPESPWSVIPEPARDFAAVTPAAPVTDAANLPETAIVMTPLNPATLYPVPARETPVQEAQISPVRVLSWVWLCGFCALLAWSLYSYLKLRRTVAASLPLDGVAASLDIGDGVRICDDISAPFVLGLIRPRIYVPSGLSDAELSCVLAHERAHIRRGDAVWKLCAWLITCLYWFRPSVWLSYALFCRDMEFACDEAAIRGMDAARRAAYSEALLQCGLGRRKLQVCPLAFGETGVKERVKAVLRYRSPALWLTCAAAGVCVLAAVCLLTRPADAGSADDVSETDALAETLSDGVTQSDALAETLSDGVTQSDALAETLSDGVTEALPDAATLSDAATRSDSGKEPLEWVTVDADAIGNAGSVACTLSPELERAVRDAILTYQRDRYADADFDAESHVLLGMFPDAVETEADSGAWENVVTLYLMTLFNGYDYRDGRFEDVTGRSGPAVLTFRVDADGANPRLADYWEPRDGSYYWPDVREKFPKSLTDAELDTQTYIVQETQDCYRQAVEHGNVDVTPVLDELFDKIAESPATSSNPGDYLNAHPLEVRELLYYGDYTRAYIYERAGDAPGLRQHLMKLVLERLDALTWNQPGVVTDLSALGKLVHATLTHIHDYTGPEPLPGTYSLSDAEKLSALRELFAGAEALNGPTKCPFEDVLTLTDENGVTLQLALAADSCAIYRFAGRYYKYAPDNAKLYALFT